MTTLESRQYSLKELSRHGSLTHIHALLFAVMHVSALKEKYRSPDVSEPSPSGDGTLREFSDYITITAKGNKGERD